VGKLNFRDELGEVWVPKDAGELEGLLLTIQNEPGKKILKHKIQQALKEKRHKNSLNNWNQDLWDDGVYIDWDESGSTYVDWYDDSDDD
jgi:hypothetical protein